MSESNKEHKKTKKKPCVSYVQKGKCAFGDRCRNSHDSSLSSANGVKATQSPAKTSGVKATQSPAKTSGVKATQSPAKTSGVQANRSASTSGPRRKGQPPASSTSRPLKAPSIASTNVSRSPTPPDPSIMGSDDEDMCNFYPNCNDDGCALLHVDPMKRMPPHPPARPTPSANRPCNYALKGSCNLGPQCKHDHPADHIAAPVKAVASSNVSNRLKDTYRPASPFGYTGIDVQPNDQEEATGVDDEGPDSDGTEDGTQYSAAPMKQTSAYGAELGAAVKNVTEIVEYKESLYEFNRNRPRNVPRPAPPPIIPHVAPPPAIPHIAQVILHWSQFADPYADGNTAFCKQLAQNNCFLQEKCRFRHSLTLDEYTLLFKDQQPNLSTIGQSPETARQQPLVYTAVASPLSPQQHVSSVTPPAPAQTAAEPSPARTTTRVCTFFRTGNCKNGSKCPYLHAGTPIGDNNSSEANSEQLRGSSPTQITCRFYSNNKYCKNGDNCPYSHVTSSDIQRYASQSAAAPQEDIWGATQTHDWGATEHSEDNGWGSEAKPEYRTPNEGDQWSSSVGDNRYGIDRQCHDYRDGTCRRVRCKFSHDLSSQSNRGGSDRSIQGGRYDNGSDTRRPCTFYQKNGNCRKGDECNFSHSDSGFDSGSGGSRQAVEEEVNNGWGASENLAWGDDEETNPNEVTTAEPEDTSAAEWPADDNEENGDNGWDKQSESWTDPYEDSGDTGQAKQNLACKAFGQGNCSKGDDCRYIHAPPSDQHAQESSSATSAQAPDDDEQDQQLDDQDVGTSENNVKTPPRSPSPVQEIHPIVEKVIHDCTIRFDAGCQPEEVMTAADSRKIVLSNLPVDATNEEIRQLVNAFGTVKEIEQLAVTADSSTMTIEFEDHRNAIGAVRCLNGQTFAGRVIVTRLDSRASVVARSPLHSHVLMVSWPSPTLMAWTFYDTITIAKQAAQKLDGLKFQGRTLKALFDRPGKKGPYPVRISNLPSGTSKIDVQHLLAEPAPALITLGEPTYTESPLDHVRDTLQEVGRVESFEVLPDDNISKTTAYATMEAYTAAEEAFSSLDGIKPDYIGGQTLKVQHVYLAKLVVPAKGFDCVTDEFKMLKDQYKGKCVMIQYMQQDSCIIQIHASGNEPLFPQANADLENLANGFIVVGSDDSPTWDDYLDSASGKKSIDMLNARPTDTPYFIYVDPRLKVIRVYGAEDAKIKGQSDVQKLLKTVAKNYHILDIPRLKIYAVYSGVLKTLQDKIGANKVSLDVVSSKLIVRGNPDDLEKANLAMSILPPTSTDSTVARHKLCPICERAPVEPVKMGCRHAYCQACLQFALSSTANRESGVEPFFVCVFSSNSEPPMVCGAPLSYVAVRDTLTIATEYDFLKASFVRFVHANRDRYFFCPSPGCYSVYGASEEGSVIRCMHCQTSICPHCCSRAHDGLLCGERAIVGSV